MQTNFSSIPGEIFSKLNLFENFFQTKIWREEKNKAFIPENEILLDKKQNKTNLTHTFKYLSYTCHFTSNL